jgi:hemoglobin
LALPYDLSTGATVAAGAYHAIGPGATAQERRIPRIRRPIGNVYVGVAAACAAFMETTMIHYRRTVVRAILMAGFAGMLAACQSMQPMHHDMMAPKTSLYDRLGGKPAITAVVDDFVGNVAADDRISHFFAHTDISRLKMLLVEQICAGTGGPCTYAGRDMKTTHQGMNITDADFNALVGDLVKSLDKFKVPEKEQGELLAILGPMKPQIVGQ